MPSFSIPLTGLQANSVALSTIGNNLANLNTTAFKKQEAQFSDLFYQNIGSSGSGSPVQVGVGTRVASIDSDFSQGSLSTNSDTANMALDGDGFFVVNQGGTTELTRAGNFQLSSTGMLETTTGANVMGYAAKNGVLQTNAALSAINIPTSTTQPAQATTEFSFTTALDSSAEAGTSFTATDTMYDSLGTSHDVSVTFTKTGSLSWDYSVTLPSGEATATTGNTGSLTFNADGSLATPTSNVTGISFTGLSDNASDMNLTWDLHDSSGNSLVTQSATTSATNAKTQNGYASGSYKSFSVDSSGVNSATYSNGSTEVLGQVAVATVANEEALQRTGDNNYAATVASGEVNVGVAGSGGRGSVEDSTLEGSNVDISTEFANLIVAQRSFEANSKTVTAFDTITQDTIAMIR